MFVLGLNLPICRYLLTNGRVASCGKRIWYSNLDRTQCLAISGSLTTSAPVAGGATESSPKRNDDEADSRPAISPEKRRNFGSILRSVLKSRFLKVEAEQNDLVLQSACFRIYSQCANLNFVRFIETFKMNDTLESWFMVTGLHVWFILLRLRQEPDADNGSYDNFRDTLMDVLWQDVKQRLETISSRNLYLSKKTMREETSRYYAYLMTSMIELDEGIMRDDMVLAGALWRLFYKTQQVDDAVVLNELVRYVRKQVYQLNRRSMQDVISEGVDAWDMSSS